MPIKAPKIRATRALPGTEHLTNYAIDAGLLSTQNSAQSNVPANVAASSAPSGHSRSSKPNEDASDNDLYILDEEDEEEMNHKNTLKRKALLDDLRDALTAGTGAEVDNSKKKKRKQVRPP